MSKSKNASKALIKLGKQSTKKVKIVASVGSITVSAGPKQVRKLRKHNRVAK